jgi:hypothetical protein
MMKKKQTLSVDSCMFGRRRHVLKAAAAFAAHALKKSIKDNSSRVLHVT